MTCASRWSPGSTRVTHLGESNYRELAEQLEIWRRPRGPKWADDADRSPAHRPYLGVLRADAALPRQRVFAERAKGHSGGTPVKERRTYMKSKRMLAALLALSLIVVACGDDEGGGEDGEGGGDGGCDRVIRFTSPRTRSGTSSTTAGSRTRWSRSRGSASWPR